MAHQRKAIRDAVVAIVTGLATTGARVFPSRSYPYDPEKGGGAALLVYAMQEASEPDTLGPGRKLSRALDVVIESVAMVNETLDDLLDQIAKEIEVAMAGAGLTLGGVCKDQWLRETRLVFGKLGEKQTGGFAMTYTVLYRTTQANPEALA